MDKPFGSERFENEWHPGEDDLLYYADGELSAAKSAEIKTHLEACWTCRAKTAKIQRTISSFIEYLNDGFIPNVDPPPMGWRTFDGKMNQAAAEAIKRPLLSRWRESARNQVHWGLSVRWTASLLAALGIAFAFAHFQSTSPVSANQLIQKATEAQEQRIRRVTHAVVYQKLRVQRRGAAPLENGSITGTLERSYGWPFQAASRGCKGSAAYRSLDLKTQPRKMQQVEISSAQERVFKRLHTSTFRKFLPF